MDEDILHELDDVHIATKMRGYDPVEVDDLLDRARREIEDLRTTARRAGARAEGAEAAMRHRPLPPSPQEFRGFKWCFCGRSPARWIAGQAGPRTL